MNTAGAQRYSTVPGAFGDCFRVAQLVTRISNQTVPRSRMKLGSTDPTLTRAPRLGRLCRGVQPKDPKEYGRRESAQAQAEEIRGGGWTSKAGLSSTGCGG